MISKNNYLNALDTVIKYHEQIERASIKYVNQDRVLTKDFLKASDLPTRIQNALKHATDELIRYKRIGDARGIRWYEDYEYLEDITKEKFLNLRFVGKKYLDIFDKEKEDYLNERNPK